MHPVLKNEIHQLADEARSLTLEEADTHPLPGQGRWSAQQVLEHLILTYKLTIEEVRRTMAQGRPPKRRRGPLEIFLRLQTIGLGYMPQGIPATIRVKPRHYEPQAGPELTQRFLAAAEEMDTVLQEARRKFGIQACGEHPFYGPLRVDEWRRYHSVHARHHVGQLRQAIKFARSPKPEAKTA